MIGVGLIGAGFIGRNHFNQYEKLTDRCRLLVLCDKEADRRAGDWSSVGGNLADAQGTQRDLGNIRSCSDWREVIEANDVDLVDICVPTILHPEIAVAALAAGKNVLCEKPMALTVEACDTMIAAAEASSGRLMVAQCVRFWPEYAYLKNVFDERSFGELKAVHFRRQAGTPDHSLGNWMIEPNQSGGAIIDLHIHDVDFALSMLGQPTSVYAQGYTRPNGSLDRIHAMWRFDGTTTVVVFEGLWDLPTGFPFNMGFTAVFEEASIVWDISTGEPLMVYRTEAEPETPEVGTEDAFCAEIAYFLDCIERGEDPSLTTPGESRQAVAIALAEKESALTGKPVAV